MHQKYYVAGCVDNSLGVDQVEDQDAEFWTLYARDASGESEALADFADRRSAEAAMAVYVERDALDEQVRALAVQWTLVGETGNPSVPVGERAEFWVCHAGKNGQLYVAKLTWFNHFEPHEDDQDAIDCCEMSTPDGENYWPVGWHEEFASHDFEHFFEPSQLKVVAYAPFAAPDAPITLRAGEVPNV